MSQMQEIMLEQFAHFQRGFDITKAMQVDGPYSVISSSGPSSFHNEAKVKGPGVIIGRKGTLGTVFYSEDDFWPHDTTLWVTNFHGNNPKYAYYFLKTLHLEQYDCGASNPALNRNHIHTLKIRVPVVTVQQKIASILSAYDDLIENNTRRIQLLEEMARALYREWFVEFRFPGHEGVEMVETENRRIPQGWRFAPISELLSLLSGFAFKSADFVADGEFKLVTIRNVHDGQFIPHCQNFISEIPKSMPKYCLIAQNDLLLSLTGNIGRVCIAWGNNYLLNQRVAKIQPKSDHDRAYIYYFMRSSEVKSKLDELSTGVAQQNLSPVETVKIKMLIPSPEILDRYNNVVTPIFSSIIALHVKITNLHLTRDLLLPKLVSGEVDASNLNIATAEAAA